LGADILELYDITDKNMESLTIKNLSLAGYDPKIVQKLTNIKINGKTFQNFDLLKNEIGVKKKISIDLHGIEYEAIANFKSIGLLGFRPSMKFEAEKIPQDVSISDAALISIDKIGDNISSSLKGLKMIFTGILSVKDNLSGPIGIVQIAGITLEYGFLTYLDFTARISIALMIMNLLPIPIADGGHVVLYLYEAISGRPLPARVIDIIFKIGLVFLLSLGIFVTFNDFIRLLK
jgi:regulator of sigma E protease